MSKLINVTRAFALGATLLLSLAGCGSGSDSDNGPDGPADDTGYLPKGSVSGRVTDALSGAPVAGVEVKIGTLKATSDATGQYAIESVPVGPQVVAQFSKPDYAVNFATVNVALGRNSVADRTVAKVGVRADISAAAGGTVTMTGSPAQVALPAAGVVTASGAPFTGTVKVEMTPIDPGINPLNMPGNFRAQNEAVPIESMGALQVELRDSTGALLNLAPGKTATIRIPVPAGATSPPLTMPLYYFKESTGLWVREGQATLAGTAPQQYYEGQVSHFTVWNADQPMDTIYVNGCVVDGNNNPIDGTVVSEGVDYYGSDSVSTTPIGKFRVAVRRSSRVQIHAHVGNDVGSVTISTGTTDITLPECIKVAKLPPVIVTQPADLTIAPGFFGTLTVEANNAQTYTWYRNGVALTFGGPSINLLGVMGVAGEYRVVVSNAYGSVTSTTVIVTVSLPTVAPLITSAPVPVSVLVGATPVFSVQATGDSLSYQWLRNGVAIAGAQGPELTLPPATIQDNNALFSVRVTNSAGSITSDPARLTVTAEAVIPSIVTPPANVSAAVGQNAVFGVAVTGTGPFTYQWLRNGAVIAGATGDSYQTPALTLADHGAQFSVRVTNVKGTVTSAAASLSVTATNSVPGLHLPFTYGSPVNNQLAYGAIPAAGGTPVPLQPAGLGYSFAPLVQGQISNGVATDFYTRSLMFWKNGTIVRRDLSGPNGLPPEVRVSSITSAGQCNPSVDDVHLQGNDAVDALRSWFVVRFQGLDGSCQTDDDVFKAVRANMAPTDAPLTVRQPVNVLHDSQGAVSGWLLRNGLQIVRVSADFSNPVNLFTLPADDVSFDSEGLFNNTAIFSTSEGVYSVDMAAAAPTTPTRITALPSGEFVDQADLLNQNEMLLVIGSETNTRLLRYTVATKSLQSIATVAGRVTIAGITPTRVLVRTQAGALVSYPIAGGSGQELASSANFMTNLFTYVGNERVWQETNGNVVSMNSDGSNLQTITGARLAGCVIKPQSAFAGFMPECDAVMVVVGSSLRSLDAATGAARVTYGNVNMPSGQLTTYFYFDFLTSWGKPGVLTQVVTNADFTQSSIVSYLLKTDQPGVTQIVMP